jgi:xanthine dehydrogenase accessory factor
MLSVNMTPPESSITYAEHALDILKATVSLIKDGQRCALVTSLAIEGGAAREVGSLAVVAQNGSMTGYLSNGCIDRDIMLHGLNAIETGQVKHIRYGAGSPYLDLKLPCGGALDLVIDPAPDLKTLTDALDTLRARRTAVLSFCPENGLIAGPNGPKQFCYAPKPALVLAGRGAILRTTADLATKMDFELHIASPDVDDINSIAALTPNSIHRMTTPAQTLDSRNTHDIRLQRLRDNGLTEALCQTITGPIGLVPSLRSASSIAVSALAEVTSKMPVSQVTLA